MDETAISVLLRQMIREGLIGDNTVQAAAEECDAMGAPDAAHQLRLLIVEARMPSAVEIKADRIRPLRRLLDGGNQD